MVSIYSDIKNKYKKFNNIRTIFRYSPISLLVNICNELLIDRTYTVDVKSCICWVL